jgi:hypothetical protein
MNKVWALIAGVFVAFVVIESVKKYYGGADFEYDENWLGDLTGLREEKK